MRKRNFNPWLVAGLAAVALLAACDENKVGSGVNVGNGKGNAALSDPTPSPSPTPKAVPTQAPPTHAPTQAPQPTQPPRQQIQPFNIGIWGDTSGKPQFNPPAAVVYATQQIIVTNNDAAPRSFVSDSGAFDSGNIAPGHNWTYTAVVAGGTYDASCKGYRFNYHDGTRPYAVGYFCVVPH